MSVFPDGIFQYGGEPVGSIRFSSPWATTYFVDGTDGNDTFDGKGPGKAFATLTQAVATAGAEDVIYVRPKGKYADSSDVYVEDAQVTIPVASKRLSIIGVSAHRDNQYYGVFFRYGYGETDTGFILSNSAPGLCLENLGFQTGEYIRNSTRSSAPTGSGAVRMYSTDYSAHAGSLGFSCYNCFFRDGQLEIIGGYEGTVNGCTFKASGSASTGVWSTSNVLPTGGHRILNSYFTEMFGDNQTVSYIYFVPGQQVDFQIHNCRFGLVPTDNHYMWFGASCKGLVDSCYFQNADISTGANDSDSELYSADGGVQFTNVHDGSRAAPGAD